MSTQPISQQVYSLLNKDPLLKPKQICKLLDLSHKTYRRYITKLRCLWKKRYFRQREGLKRLTFHRWRGWCVVPRVVDPGDAEAAGWLVTRARNGMLLWKSDLGRLEWFPSTGRVNVWIRSPASLGKAMQLLSDAFFGSGLIFDFRVFERFVRGLRRKGASMVVEVGERLPYVKIDLLKKSNGVTITLGDRSHPTGIEVDFNYPDWAERNELILERFLGALSPGGSPNGKLPEASYWV